MTPPVHLYSLAVCPFAQRTRILLAQKGIAFSLTEIDVTRPRPEWFLKLNPLGQVPVIVHEGRVLNESSVINEYLDEVFPPPRIMPEDAYERAQSRIMIDRINRNFVPTFYRVLMCQDPAQWASLEEQMLNEWRWLDAMLMRHNPEGTWLWNRFGMADITIAPFFLRWCLQDYFRHFPAPSGEGFARVRKWLDACLKEPSVQSTGMSDENFIKLYEDYARGSANGKPLPGRAHSSLDLSVPLAERPMPERPAPLG